MFSRILDHPLIEVQLGVEYAEARATFTHCHTVFTGPIDEFFGQRFGPLPYRSLSFRFDAVPTPDGSTVQPVGQVNFPSEAVPYTRITEFRHFEPPATRPYSTLAYEYPSATGDPFYPVPAPENRQRYRRYEVLARRSSDVTFVGRLARYQYLNMDQVVGQALQTFARRAPVIAEAARSATKVAA
jgi:UDP-galactopyranose mutase